MLRNNATEKAVIYETLSSMNRSFAGIVAQLESFRQSGVITAKYARLFQGFAQEVEAEINLEVLQAMDSVENEDWARFGKVREKWEKYLKGPEPKTLNKKRSKKES